MLIHLLTGLLLILAGCSHHTRQTKEIEEGIPQVSVETTLEHIRQSYILGCSEASKDLGADNFYPKCRDLGVKHSEAVRKLIESQP